MDNHVKLSIQDMNVEVSHLSKPKADLTNETHIGATMPGTVLKVAVSKGSKVKRGRTFINHRSNENGNNCTSTIQW